MFFRKKRPETVPLRPGERAPDFQLPSVQGGLFRLEMRAAHGPVLLAFVNVGEESRELLERLKEHEGGFRRAGAYNYPYPNPEIREGGVPSTRSGTTVAIVVRAASMGPVRELQKSMGLPFYVLWDDRSMVSTRYGVGETEIPVVLVETDGKLAWRSEPDQLPHPEEMLREIRPAPGTVNPAAETHETPSPEAAVDSSVG
ncbi:hypothetical protein GBA63_19510 [Rubrobacter tropicus]|uniref:Redoxin domain-containing protein n=1 Tax=Rubrobacter tropicus TaxID=2653851 RepID=A0A6G8QDK7_9ACTN|nr:hypothetical protein [Rubrobacter tropicus]QIN84590.1 hypothetical protein GBA63_19510 [Rubrobacter tropicus]